MESIELESLLQSTELISQELNTIRKDLQQGSTPQPGQNNPLDYVERAIYLRESFRAIADGIEAKRALAQLQKEKIERSKNYIEGLQYYKATLISKIGQAQIDSVDLKQFFDEPLQIKDWVQDYQNIQDHMKKAIDHKKQQKDQLQQLYQEKRTREVQRRNKKELHEKTLPEKAQRLYDEALDVAKLCEIKEFQSVSGILSPKLSIVNEKILPLRIDETINVSLSRDLYEELEIVILKKDQRLFKLAQSNKILLEEREIKITIASLEPDCKKLVIGLDRREDFNNEEVFQRLINNETIKPVFIHPKNEAERNINAKFIRVDWIENALMTGIIHPFDIISAIKERVFSLMLIGYIKDNMKKINFFFPVATTEEVQSNNIPNLKKSLTGSLDQITFQEFLEIVHVPSWVEKYRIKYQELEQQGQNLGFNEQKMCNIDKNNYLEALKIFKLEEMDEENLNFYLKGTLNVNQGILQFVLVVPFAYPRQPSKVVITNWQKRKEEERKGMGPGLEGVPCLTKVSAPRRMFSSRILVIEREVNDQIGQFLKESDNEPFRVLLQINRLISLLGLHAQKRI